MSFLFITNSSVNLSGSKKSVSDTDLFEGLGKEKSLTFKSFLNPKI